MKTVEHKSLKAPQIHPQYVDNSKASKELQACIKCIDAILDLESVRGIGIPDCFRPALHWANERATSIMEEMDQHEN